MTTATATYQMNPAEDVVLFGDELAEGMLVLIDEEVFRAGGNEDARLRSNRFCKVTKLRRYPASGGLPAGIAFVGEWVDGYQQARKYAEHFGWIVKKDSIPAGDGTEGDDQQ